MAITQIGAFRTIATNASLYVRPATELARRLYPLMTAPLRRKQPNMVRIYNDCAQCGGKMATG